MLGCRGAKKRWQHRDKKDQQLCKGALRKITIDGLDTSDRWFLGRGKESMNTVAGPYDLYREQYLYEKHKEIAAQKKGATVGLVRCRNCGMVWLW
ncbi:hypothetical protein L3X38_045113 [Prunus dulcis]|uniref:Uncharacterized protein n=1 Tax=Prunus dulcis TaxID=3755 RepID=A0AAD4YMT8_PRUDU|nr:hypothetical protein L3X38_045113 [Prunus dulcis]